MTHTWQFNDEVVGVVGAVGEDRSPEDDQRVAPDGDEPESFAQALVTHLQVF